MLPLGGRRFGRAAVFESDPLFANFPSVIDGAAGAAISLASPRGHSHMKSANVVDFITTLKVDYNVTHR